MENKKDNPHLKIETVTPDTEKDGLPNDQKNNHPVPGSEKPDTTESKSTPNDAESLSAENEETAAAAKDDAEQTKAQTDESRQQQQPDEDDERDKIETVSP